MLRKSGISLEALDRSTRPQDDLFRFVNGTWLDTTEIPDDRARFGTFDILREESTARVRDLIEEAARAEEGAPGTPKRQVGDLYASFTDTDRIEELGLAPLQAVMSEVAAVDSVESLGRALGRLARDGVVGVLQHFVVTRRALAGGLRRLPRAGRARTPRRVLLPRGEVRRDPDGLRRPHRPAARPRGHPGRRGQGDPRHDARDASRRRRTGTRSPTATRSRPTTPTPSTRSWSARAPVPLARLAVRARGAGGFVRQGRRPPAELRHRSRRCARVGGRRRLALVADVARRSRSSPRCCRSRSSTRTSTSTGRTLSGQPENKERWKRGVSVVEACVGEAVGQLYAERWFPPAAKARMQELVGNLVEAFRRSFSSLEWMGPQTRVRRRSTSSTRSRRRSATPTCGATTPASRSTGRPRRQRPAQHGVRVRPQPREARPARSTAPSGSCCPQTVNAYYHAVDERDRLPGRRSCSRRSSTSTPTTPSTTAGSAPSSVTRSGTASTTRARATTATGHCATGGPRPTAARFDERTQALIAQFGQLSPAGLSEDHKVNGGADGRREHRRPRWPGQIGYSAYRIATEDGEMPELDGFTGPQRFFIGLGAGLEGQGPRGRGDPAARRRPALAARTCGATPCAT